MMPEEITKFFKEYVWGFMYNDITNSTDKAGANFLVALGLSVYTEVMGGLATGELKNRDWPGKNYGKFLEYLGPYYVELDGEIDLYNRVRCGLAHEYFIKGPHIIARELVDEQKSSATKPGILYVQNETIVQTGDGPIKLEPDTIIFGLRNYFRDFKTAVDKYYADLLQSGNEELVAKFDKALKPRS